MVSVVDVCVCDVVDLSVFPCVCPVTLCDEVGCDKVHPRGNLSGSTLPVVCDVAVVESEVRVMYVAEGYPCGEYLRTFHYCPACELSVMAVGVSFYEAAVTNSSIVNSYSSTASPHWLSVEWFVTSAECGVPLLDWYVAEL